MCKNVKYITSAPSNSKTEVTLKQSDIDGNTTCTICIRSFVLVKFSPCVQYTGIIVIMKSHFDVCKVITESFTKVQEISGGNCDGLSFSKKTDQLVESKKITRVKKVS